MMKHILFILALIVLIVIAAKVFFWALKTILVLAVIALIAYVALRLLTGKKAAG